jgi:hypothetical protein
VPNGVDLAALCAAPGSQACTTDLGIARHELVVAPSRPYAGRRISVA